MKQNKRQKTREVMPDKKKAEGESREKQHLKEKLEEDIRQHEQRREELGERTEAVRKQIEEKTIRNVRRNTYSFKRLFHAAFNLSADQADYDEIAERIESGVVLRGTNMCILILAIFIASVGLNMNSTAVIIGAMLVSPLMGAIMGIGFSIAIHDMNLLKRSATILMFEVVVALATSTVYFVITPIKTASAEILARTSPTAWDVIIAVCGGLAGMIGTTRKEKSNIIPGVAIATALMPPLCTAGYGLAVSNIRYFAGAMYLFCINGIFIAISTMLITVFLRIPSKNAANDETKKQIVKRVIMVAVVAIVPSVFLGADIVKSTVFDNNVSSFVEQEFRFDNTQVVKYSVDQENKELKVAVIGTTLDESTIAGLERSMKSYHIDNLMLKVQQTEVKAGITTDELEAYVKNETSQLTAENEADYQDLQSQLIAVKSELSEYQEKEIEVESLQEEISVLYVSVTAMQAGYLDYGGSEKLTVILEVKKPLSVQEMRRVRSWLSKRLEVEAIAVYQNSDGVLYPADYRIPEKEENEEEEVGKGTGEEGITEENSIGQESAGTEKTNQ